jgi:hypothetical protein
MICPKCGGDLVGDGYSTVIHCEYADPSMYEYNAPDDGPVLCDFKEEEDDTTN